MDSNPNPSPRPPHTGLLRDETLLLRLILGYDNEVETVKLPKSLFPAQKLRRSNMRDVLFLSMDIDALQEHKGVIQQFHIGISILDTASLEGMVVDSPDGKLTSGAIESHHFAVGKPNLNLQTRLDAWTRHRHAVLVFHGGARELWVLKRLGIDLDLRCIIDTVKAAQHPLQLYYRYSLEKLLDGLGIPYCDLHSSGNDAHFVLRALLMIAVRDAERQLHASDLPEWVSTFKAIAQSPFLT